MLVGFGGSDCEMVGVVIALFANLVLRKGYPASWQVQVEACATSTNGYLVDVRASEVSTLLKRERTTDTPDSRK